ncbi:hypothetical protein B0F88_101322 [Methylobacter tundripaludum]|uniref:Uncharacterized protein n=1 Tax=Methylobacter tundripaludum TaxID=173365 RepID=A0A2S6H8N8_9GAMM|nr:hypothetical protein B0F88_101322 [Methylobacter tundripaludum]
MNQRAGFCNPDPYVLLYLCLMAILHHRKTFQTGDALLSERSSWMQ